MEITYKEIEYKTANYRIQVEVNKGKATVWVFDPDNNIVASFDSLKEAENLSRDILEILDQLKI